jgi:hypothetical protein
MDANKRAMPTGLVDSDDAPELSDDFFERADEFVGDKLVRRGRPPVAVKRPTLNMRVDALLREAVKRGRI